MNKANSQVWLLMISKDDDDRSKDQDELANDSPNCMNVMMIIKKMQR